MYPFKNDVNFEIVAYGTNSKGKLIVESKYNKAAQQWMLHKIALQTRNNYQTII